MRALKALVVLLACLALAPGVAQAGVGASTGIVFPSTVTVGQTGLPSSLTLGNANTSPNAGDTNSVCNAGEASPPCSSPEQGITLIPSCAQVAAAQCQAGGADPGVFSLSPTGAGRLGTSCAGMTFTVSIIDPAFGTVRFTPQPAGAHVTLPGAGSSCAIDFTFDVLKSPTADANPIMPGRQTVQTTRHTQWAGPFGPGALNAVVQGASGGATVLAATPTIATNASANITLGAGTLTDTATMSGRVNPQSGATITFSLYGPNNAT